MLSLPAGVLSLTFRWWLKSIFWKQTFQSKTWGNMIFNPCWMVEEHILFRRCGQPIVNWWFGARWFGFLGSPCEEDCYLGVPLETQTTNPNHQFTISWWGWNHQLVDNARFFLTKMPREDWQVAAFSSSPQAHIHDEICSWQFRCVFFCVFWSLICVDWIFS